MVNKSLALSLWHFFVCEDPEDRKENAERRRTYNFLSLSEKEKKMMRFKDKEIDKWVLFSEHNHTT